MRLHQYILFLFICLVKSQDNELFPEFEFYDANALSFPKKILIDGDSDTVILKCPFKSYKHFSEIDKFEPNSNTNNLFLAGDDSHKLQYVIQKNTLPYKNYTELNCGKLTVTTINISTLSYDWKYKLKWQNKDILMKAMKDNSVSNDVLKMCSECSSASNLDYSNYIIKFKGEKFIVLKKDKKYDLFKNDILYYFSVHKDTEPSSVIYPCCKRKLTGKIPSIKIHSNLTESNTKESIDIYETSSPTQTFKLSLLPDESNKYEKFFSKEKISMVEMKYNKDGLTEVVGTEKEIKEEVVVDKYKIIKFYYQCPECEEKTTAEKVVFLSPPKDKRLVTNPPIVDEPSVRSNCSMNAFNFAYLQSISFGDQSITVDELLSKSETGIESFVIENTDVLYRIQEPTGLLTCTYITPDGTYTTKTKFRNPLPPTTTQVPKDNKEVKKEEKKISLSGEWLAVIIIVCLLSVLFLVCCFICSRKEFIKKDFKNVFKGKKSSDKGKKNEKSKKNDESSSDRNEQNIEKSVEKSKEYSRENLSGVMFKKINKSSRKEQAKVYNVAKIQAMLPIDSTQFSVRKPRDNRIKIKTKSFVQTVSKFVVANGEEHQIAAFQAPTNDSIEEMFGMIYKYNIGLVLMNVGVNEKDFHSTIAHCNLGIEQTGASVSLLAPIDLCSEGSNLQVIDYLKLIVEIRAFGLLNYKLYLFALHLFAYHSTSTLSRLGSCAYRRAQRNIHRQKVGNFINEKILPVTQTA